MMLNKKICEGCGREVARVGYFLDPIYEHELNDETCLRNQIEDLREIEKDLKRETEKLKLQVFQRNQILKKEKNENKRN